MAKCVGVQYEGSTKIYTYLQNVDELKVGDKIRVPSARGESNATVAKVDYPEGYEKDLPYKLKMVFAKPKAEPLPETDV